MRTNLYWGTNMFITVFFLEDMLISSEKTALFYLASTVFSGSSITP